MASVSISLNNFRDAGGELVYSSAENKWYTADSLGFIYRFDSDANKFQQLPAPATDNEITCFAINSTGNECVLGYTSSVHIHKFPGDVEVVKEGYLCRRTLPITSVKYDSKNANVMISSKEPDIIIQSLLDSSVKTKISSFSTGVRGFSLSNDNKFICVMCEAGFIYLHSLQVDVAGNIVGNNMMKKFGDLINIAAIRNSATGFKVSWSPEGTAPVSLVVPSKDGCAVVFTYNSTSNEWDETPIVSGDDDINHNKKDLNLAVYSPDGKHIATADLAGNIIVWDTAKYNPARKFVNSTSEPLVDLVWGTDNDMLLVSATSFVKIESVIAPTASAQEATEEVAADAISDADMASFFDTVEGADKEPAYKPEPKASLAAMLDDAPAAALAAEPVTSNKLNRLQKVGAASNDDDDDDIFNADGPADSTWRAPAPESVGESIKEMKRMGRATLGDEDNDEKMLDDDYADDASLPAYDQAQLEELLKTALPAAAALKLQEPFQPASTDYNDKRRRYLCWNYAGDITCREENVAFRYEMKVDGRNEIIQNHHEFTRGALAREGAVFATDPEEKDDAADTDMDIADGKKALLSGSTVFYKAFKGFQIPNFDFEYKLEDGDAAVAVAAGSGWCAVATDKGFLHVLSSTGVTISVSWLKGPVVSMIGRDSRLAVIYHAAAPMGDSFCLSLELHEVAFSTKRSLLNGSIAVPLTRGSKLQWCGFDEEFGGVVIMDSEYMVSMLMRAPSFEWVPIIDLAKHRKPGHEFWPVRMLKDLESSENKILYILLNGERRPEIYPRPAPSAKTVSLPLMGLHSKSSSSTNKAAKESEDFMRKLVWESLKGLQWEAERDDVCLRGFDVSSYDAVLERQKNSNDKNALSLLSLACDAQNMERAFDLVDRLQTSKGRDYAKFIANKKSCPKVAVRVEELQVAIFEQEQQAQLMQQQASGVFAQEQENEEPRQSASLFSNCEEEVPSSARGALSSRALKRHNSFEEVNNER